MTNAVAEKTDAGFVYAEDIRKEEVVASEREEKLKKISQQKYVLVEDIKEFIAEDEYRLLRKRKIERIKVAKATWDRMHDSRVMYFKSYMDYYPAAKPIVTYKDQKGNVVIVGIIGATKFYEFDPRTLEVGTRNWWYLTTDVQEEKIHIAPSNVGGLRLNGRPLPKGYGK